MKVIIEFNLPEEQPEYKAAMSGSTYASEIRDFANYLRASIKYGLTEDLKLLSEKENITPDQISEVVWQIRTKLFELCPESLND